MKEIQLKSLGILLLISVVIFFLDTLGSLNPVKFVAQTVVLPVEYQLRSLTRGVTDLFSFFTFWKSGEMRIKFLEERNLELLSQVNEVTSLREENKELRRQLQAPLSSPRALLPATVLGMERYLAIGVGAADGVKSNLSVVYLNNLVGRVVKVTPRVSFVQLPTDADAKIPAKLGITSSIRGLAIGQFNTSIVLDRLSQNEEVKIDDLVFTSGEGDYEPNLVIGKVSGLSSSATDIFKKMPLVPLVNYGRLLTVFVILK